MSRIATLGYANLDDEALCIDADLIFDEMALISDEDEAELLELEAEADLDSVEYDELHLGVSRYA